MDIPTQLSLDFETTVEPKLAIEYGFLIDEPELGLAKITKETATSVELFFESKEIFRTVNKSNRNLHFLNQYPESLKVWEEFPKAMELAHRKPTQTHI